MQTSHINRENVAALMPRLKDDLVRLVAIPSVSSPGFPEETRPALLDTHEAVVGLFREVGVEKLGSLELPDTAPVITGEIPGPEGAPTVLLYGHYDVVPAGDESEWGSPPFEAIERDGAIFADVDHVRRDALPTVASDRSGNTGYGAGSGSCRPPVAPGSSLSQQNPTRSGPVLRVEIRPGFIADSSRIHRRLFCWASQVG